MLFIGGYTGELRCLDTTKLTQVKGFPKKTHFRPITVMKVTKEGDKLVTTGWNKSIVVLHIASKKVVREFKNVTYQWIGAMDFVSDNTRVCVGSYGGEMLVICLRTGKIIIDFGKPHSGIYCLILSNDGKSIFSTDHKTGHVKKWSAETYDLQDQIKFGEKIEKMTEIEVAK